MRFDTDRVVSLSAMLIGVGPALIEVTYKSVYGERWRVSSDSVVPKPL
jgi:hypothetical protein